MSSWRKLSHAHWVTQSTFYGFLVVGGVHVWTATYTSSLALIGMGLIVLMRALRWLLGPQGWLSAICGLCAMGLAASSLWRLGSNRPLDHTELGMAVGLCALFVAISLINLQGWLMMRQSGAAHLLGPKPRLRILTDLLLYALLIAVFAVTKGWPMYWLDPLLSLLIAILILTALFKPKIRSCVF